MHVKIEISLQNSSQKKVN